LGEDGFELPCSIPSPFDHAPGCTAIRVVCVVVMRSCDAP
jgi:hypothetical protein